MLCHKAYRGESTRLWIAPLLLQYFLPLQLIHVGFKVAAQLGDEYLDALAEFEAVIARNVTGNILHRHMEKIFPRPA